MQLYFNSGAAGGSADGDYKIYGLFDKSGCRYIGKTERPLERRYAYHFFKSKLKEPTYKNNWLKKILRDGEKPEIVLLEAIDNKLGVEFLNEKERAWISFGRRMGWKLTNTTDGGDGVVGHKHSKESKAKISATATNGKQSHQIEQWKDGNLVATYPSIAESRRQGFPDTWAVIHGKKKHCKGYDWRVKNAIIL